LASFTVSLQGAIPPSTARPSAKALAARACNYFISNIADALKSLCCFAVFCLTWMVLNLETKLRVSTPIAAEGIRGLLPKQRFLSVKEHCDS
jgi:hypothetical protein